SRYLGQTFFGAAEQLVTSRLEQNVRHVGDQSAGRIACSQDGVELGEQASTKIGFLFLCLLAKTVRLFSCLASFVGLYRKLALLRFRRAARCIGFLTSTLCGFFLLRRFLRGLLRFRPHPVGVGLRGFGLRPCIFCLEPRGFRVSTALGFRVR